MIVAQRSMGGCFHTSYITVLSDQPVMLGKSHHHQQHTHCVAWEPDIPRSRPAEKWQGWEQRSSCLTLFPMHATVLSRPWPSTSASLPSVDPLMKVGGKCMIQGMFFLPLAMAISPSFPVHYPLVFHQFSSVAQSCPILCEPMDCKAHQASLSITNSQSLFKLTSIKLVMPSNHLILCRPLLFLPSIFPSIRVFPNESALRIRWPKYWSLSFSISPTNEHPGLISFRMEWLDLLAVQGTLNSFL